GDLSICGCSNSASLSIEVRDDKPWQIDPIVFKQPVSLYQNSCHMDDLIMKQALLIVDVQPSFPMSIEILQEIRVLSAILPSVATVERHNESVTPFERQLGWKPGKADESLVSADRVFIKHGYLPPPAAVEYLRDLQMDRILVCGTQTDTCVLAAGFALFDA